MYPGGIVMCDTLQLFCGLVGLKWLQT